MIPLIRTTSLAWLAGGLLALPAMATEPLVAPAAETQTAEQVAPPTDDLRAELDAMAAELRRAREDAKVAREEIREMRRTMAVQAKAEQAATEEAIGIGEPVVVLEGHTVHEVVGIGDEVHVLGEVLGDATSVGGNVRIGPSGVVRGDAVSVGGRVLIEAGGEVRGDRVSLDLLGRVDDAVQPSEAELAAGSLGTLAQSEGLLTQLYRQLILLLGLAGAGVLVVGVAPDRVGNVAGRLEARPILSAFVGTLATGSLLLFGAVVLLFTLGLGFPITLVVWAVLGLAWLLGFVGICQSLGARLPIADRPQGQWLAFLIGVVLLACASSLPMVGWLVVLATSVMGVGASLTTRLGAR